MHRVCIVYALHARHPHAACSQCSDSSSIRAPRWASLGLTDGQHSIGYDIDHPQALTIMRAFLQQLLLALHHPHGCHPAIFGFQLANEPALRGTSSRHTKVRASNDHTRSAPLPPAIAQLHAKQRHMRNYTQG